MRSSTRSPLLLAFLLLLPIAGARAQDVERQAALRWLADRGITFNDTSFLRYADQGNTEVLRRFIDAGVHVGAKNEEGKTAIELAVENGHWLAARMLEAHGADVRPIFSGRYWYHSLLNFFAKTSGLLIAIVGGFFTFFYNRRQHELNERRAEESRIQEERRAEEGERLHLLEATGKMIPHFRGGTKDAAFVTLMSLAGSTKLITSLADIYPGRAAAVACLDILDEQAAPGDLEQEECRELRDVQRPLFYSLFTAAQQEGELGVIELLKERLRKNELRKILDDIAPQGRTALMNAAIHNRGGNIEKLAKYGARIDSEDDGKETALHHAARYGHRDAAKTLTDLIKEKITNGEWTRKQAKVFLDKPNRRDSLTALQIAEDHASRPPDPDPIGDHAAVARRLKQFRENLPEPPSSTVGPRMESVHAG